MRLQRSTQCICILHALADSMVSNERVKQLLEADEVPTLTEFLDMCADYAQMQSDATTRITRISQPSSSGSYPVLGCGFLHQGLESAIAKIGIHPNQAHMRIRQPSCFVGYLSRYDSHPVLAGTCRRWRCGCRPIKCGLRSAPPFTE